MGSIPHQTLSFIYLFNRHLFPAHNILNSMPSAGEINLKKPFLKRRDYFLFILCLMMSSASGTSKIGALGEFAKTPIFQR